MKLPDEITTFENIVQIIRGLQQDCESLEDNRFTWKVQPEAFPYGIWFRGEGEHSTQLLPGIFRKYNGKSNLKEPSITNHLQSRIPELYKIPNTFDKLCLAQHYEIPTRLLDWSESIFTAMYFAVTSGGEEWKTKDGKLYILNAYALNQYSGMGAGKGRIHVSDDYGTLFRAEMSYCFSPEEWSSKLSNKYKEFNFDRIDGFPYNHASREKGEHFKEFMHPVAVMPVRSNQRMIVQSSTFTLHGGSSIMQDGYKNQPFPSEFMDETISRKILHEVRIPSDKKPALKRDLFNFGIHQGTLFPEMDKQREFLLTVF